VPRSHRRLTRGDSLDDINTAFTEAESGKIIKPVIF